jgi:hypothetical protein
MAEHTSVEPQIPDVTLQECNICFYPSWSEAKFESSLDPDDVCLEDFDEVILSAKGGCDGCRLMSEIW